MAKESEQQISNHAKALRWSTAASIAATHLLSACGILRPEEIPSPEVTEAPAATLTPEPSFTPTNTLTPTLTPTPTEILTPTPDYSEFDIGNWNEIRAKEGGESVNFTNPEIIYVVEIPRPGSDVVLGIMKAQNSGGEDVHILIENFDCEFEELLKTQTINNPVETPIIPVGSGLWPVEGRPLEKISGEVFIEYAAGTIPWVISESFDIRGQHISCPKTSSFIDSFEGLHKRFAESTARIIREILEAAKKGFEEGAP